MITPPNQFNLRALQKGDKVRILCIARSAQKSELKNAESYLQSIGLKVDYGNTIGKVHYQFGGTAQERMEDFIEAWNDPEVAAIWIARGGYGSIQILEGLDFVQMAEASTPLSHRTNFTRKRSLSISTSLNDHGVEAHRKKDKKYIKPIIGYSDVTLIHSKMQKAGLPSIHAFMPLEVDTRTAFAKASFRKALFNEEIRVELRNNQNLSPQKIRGKLHGGNLSILYSMLGSEDLPDLTGGILFIEEIDEYLYHIERMMFSLKRAGKFSGLKALLVGGMTDMNDHKIPFGKNALEIIQDLTADYDYPVIFDFPAGHLENNVSLKLGMEMEILIDSNDIIFTQ
ncbi:hypothetical protein BST97_11340 [Nonlabens spongiae]|uniref:LD-carboxypeptidase n=1 Tax=Nonlabens spongiae TaxID=331648 RepID=A0A1W6MLQ1_9FLAO|nr:LD-carboxypeptidase [Nonlabens spongiae]ARN78531.1 hypothetical protein BST97_11340 [Nonlabens spongiae]